jgi:hypothetical protein
MELVIRCLKMGISILEAMLKESFMEQVQL